MRTIRETPTSPGIPNITAIVFTRRASETPSSVWENKDRFLKEVNEELTDLNALISQYNTLYNAPQGTNADKIKVLQDIYEQRKKMEDKYPADMVGYCPDYQNKIQKKLHRQLKTEFSSLGIRSLREDVIYNRTSSPHSLADFIANMSLDKVSDMNEILSEDSSKGQSVTDLARIKQSLINLYEAPDSFLDTPGEDGYAESKAFWNEHSIQYLDGINSRIFIIKDSQNQESVLKVENRKNVPKTVLNKMLSALKDVLTPIITEQQATFINSKGIPITRTLQVTAFCTGGNLIQHADKISNDDKKITSALNIYSQMTQILIKMGENNATHTDMKNTNWIIDQNERVKIADTKGFAPTENGIFRVENHTNRWHLGRVHTPYMDAPERQNQLTVGFSADKAHSYMLGKNLYQFLSGCSDDYLEDKHDATPPDEQVMKNLSSADKYVLHTQQYDFNLPIFKTEHGIELKALIQKMIKPDPNDRISLADALLVQERIKLKDECINSLNTIVNTTRFGNNDKEMIQFEANQIIAIRSAKDVNKLMELRDTLNVIAKDPITNAIYQKVKDYHNNKSSVSGRTKGNKISNAMANVPVEDRRTVLRDNATGIFLEVQKELAAHRIRGKVYLNEDQTAIDEKKAVKSFTILKEKWRSLQRPQSPEDENKEIIKPH